MLKSDAVVLSLFTLNGLAILVQLFAALFGSAGAKAETAAKPVTTAIVLYDGKLWKSVDPATGIVCYQTAGGSLSCVSPR